MSDSKEIPLEYETEELVYLVTDPDQLPRLVTCILIRPQNSVIYELSCGEITSRHYGFEISRDRMEFQHGLN